MNNSNNREFEDALRRVYERGAMSRQESDVNRNRVVLENGESVFVGERINELEGDKTITTVSLGVDSEGHTIENSRFLRICKGCLCRLNIRKSKAYRCGCGIVVCPTHCTIIGSAIYCKVKPLCRLKARLHKAFRLFGIVLKCIFTNVFGMDFEKSPDQPEPVRFESLEEENGDYPEARMQRRKKDWGFES